MMDMKLMDFLSGLYTKVLRLRLIGLTIVNDSQTAVSLK